MKYIAILCLVLISTQAFPVTKPRDVADDLSNFLTSFWPAAFGVELDIGLCDGEVHQSLSVIGDALNMIKNSTDGIINNYINAFLHVYHNREIFSIALNDCEATGPEFKEGIKKMMPLTDVAAASAAITKATLHSPWTFPKNLYTAKSSFSSGDYLTCGKALGENLKLVLAEMPSPQSVQLIPEFEAFMESFWLTAFGVPLHLNGCTSNSEDAWNVIEKAMSIINNPTDPIAIAEAVYYIAGHYSAFTKAFDGCVDSMKALAEGVVELSYFGSVEGFTSAMTGAMKSHPLGFMLNVKKAQSAFSDGRYADAGKYLGQDLEWMLEEVDEIVSF
mgnify:CR=1 FL=1|jgi:hypothetical protein